MRIQQIAAIGAATLIATVLAATPSVSVPMPSVSAQQQLGKALFFDQNLSANKNQACAACHGPAAGWTGPDTAFNAHGAVYEGSIPGRFGDRKPPSAAYATQSPIFAMDSDGVFSGGNFWDGRATGETLGSPSAEQAKGPFLNPAEQALPDSACLVYRACTSDYAGQVTAVIGQAVCNTPWPSDADAKCGAGGPGLMTQLPAGQQRKIKDAYDKFGLAIAAYEGSSEVNQFSSKYDAVLAGKAKLTVQEKAGLTLFQGKAQCSACHTVSGTKPLLTDYTFDNLGIPKNPENPMLVKDPTFVDPGLGGFLKTRPEYASFADQNLGKFKVPTLRNVALGTPGITKAYGHNGYFKSLFGIVHFYNTRDTLAACPGDYTEAQALAANCWPKPEVAANVNKAELGNLGLNTDEELALVAFMETLSDGYGG